MSRSELIEVARGDRPLDLVIQNVNLINVFTCEIYPGDIGIYGERIALVVPAGSTPLEAKETIDGTGKWAAPGFVDTHLHIESSMVTPANYAAAVLPLGTTVSVIDPHEIGNVLGMEGVRYMVEASEGLPLRVYISIPTCVPAVPGKETAGAEFKAKEISEMFTWPRVIAAAEVMDYIGVVRGNQPISDIVTAALDAGVAIQGHSPLLVGRELNAYLAAGIESDHEIRDGNEAVEKIRLGMLPLLKLSSFGNPVKVVIPAVKDLPFLDIALCTDDIEPDDIISKGHMDRVIREVIAYGIQPALAYRWASLTGARAYQLKDLGAIAPGYYANILLLNSLEDVRVNDVLINGKFVSKNGKLIIDIPEPPVSINPANSVIFSQRPSRETLRIKAPIENGSVDVNIIHLLESGMTELHRNSVPVKDGYLNLAGSSDDMCYLGVVPRHGQPHAATTVLLSGLHLREATLATTIAHDSHNLLIAGHNPEDMLMAALELEKCGGGVIFVKNQKVLGKLELPIAGLMSPKSVAELAEETSVLNRIGRELGLTTLSPILAIAGLALPVVPEVRVTDLVGLLDTVLQKEIDLF
ncbi:adenine deaminase [Pelolinea submarina]|uniref:Adenine deaminase n=1 Tax=Pelolinea submarina TaxID=913107 RepID=A0A3E0AFA2_9CHLR|nr:adenine deaminase C-terminal domain-containing protein [Pelolinea submarina]REG10366.1 adenine deaminase [Pelolinea submarina]